jgi:hypothetical protein
VIKGSTAKNPFKFLSVELLVAVACVNTYLGELDDAYRLEGLMQAIPFESNTDPLGH